MAEATGSERAIPLGGSAADRRLRRRRRAEWRLKAYGIAAILFSAAALVALLGSIVVKAIPVVTESYLTIPVEITEQTVDPDGARVPDQILRADFNSVTRDALTGLFPAVEGRTERRELTGLLSSGASFDLARRVSGNPDLVGETVEAKLLASDTADLYLKGAFGELQQREVRGLLSVAMGPEAETARISSSVNDFSGALAVVKNSLLDDAQRLRRQAGLQDNGVQAFQRRAENAETEQERQVALDQVEARSQERDRLIAEAIDLERRARSASGAEELDRRNLSVLIEVGGGWFKVTELDTAGAEAQVLLPPEAPVEDARDWQMYVTEEPERARQISDSQIAWIEELRDMGNVEQVFNWRFFSAGDSREPELAGIWGAAVGSAWTMLVTFCLAFPIGVLSAIYLEEFAPKNRFTDFIEVNINNLAAVPSIVFGLLGLAVFLGFFGVPRSAPLAGGIVLALMTLPTIIIAARAAIRAVPPSIRDAALGIGASKLQSTFHHVLPLAMPGILTGTIIGMAQALGETAPLIMIGMVAFIVDIPTGITDSATVLPVQIYRWSDFPERAFEARTSAAICVLLTFLVIMNALAVFLRKRFERRW